jgi:hypothetical protein
MDGMRCPDPEDGLAAMDAPVSAVPWPVAAVVSVHYLQGAHRRAVQVDSPEQVRCRLGDLDDLDKRATDQWDLLARRRRAGVDRMGGNAVE